MYQLEFLDSSIKDMIEIAGYISNNLNNKSAAYSLINKIISSANDLVLFPYSSSIDKSLTNTKLLYRKIKIKNYYIFYTIDAKNKKVIVVRVLYSKRNYKTIM